MPADVSARATLAIILGASAWPESPRLAASSSFAQSATGFRDYLLADEGFGLPPENLLDLFDSARPPSELDAEIARFLDRRTAELASRGAAPTDLIVYYVGHGGFTGKGHDYFLAVRATREDSEGISSIRMADLADTLQKRARRVRRYLILDSCFAASAYAEFQAAPLAVAREKLLEAFPGRGTALLCSSGARDPSLAPAGQPHTMFSGVLLDVLRGGEPEGPAAFSLADVAERVRERVVERFPDEHVRPEVHSPEQREGDIAGIPLFPNPAVRARLLREQIAALNERLEKVEWLKESDPGERRAEVRRASRRHARSRDVVEQVPAASVHQTEAPDPTPTVSADATLEPERPAPLVPEKPRWKKIVLAAAELSIPAAIAIAMIYWVLSAPRFDVTAMDVDWEPRSPAVGQAVTFTGKFSMSYRVRQGLRWQRDEITGRPLAATFTARWSVDGRPTEIEDPRTIRTGEILDTRFQTTFSRPGRYAIEFSVKGRLGGSAAASNKVVRTIVVQEPVGGAMTNDTPHSAVPASSGTSSAGAAPSSSPTSAPAAPAAGPSPARITSSSTDAAQPVQASPKQGPRRRRTDTRDSSPNVTASRPSRRYTVNMRLVWDRGEGATPEIRMSGTFSCGPWREVPLSDQTQELSSQFPYLFSKERACARSVSASGTDSIEFFAREGRVYVLYATQLEGDQPVFGDLHWIERGQRKSAPLAWRLD